MEALALSEGATGLLEGVEDGGELFRTACAAMPLAADADLALGRLGEVALFDDASLSDVAILTIHRIAGKAPSRGEPLDPDGVVAAADAMLRLASQKSLPPERRARAISAARLFAERGVLNPDRIPADQDPALAGSP